jgi:hypothetical protein
MTIASKTIRSIYSSIYDITIGDCKHIESDLICPVCHRNMKVTSIELVAMDDDEEIEYMDYRGRL